MSDTAALLRELIAEVRALRADQAVDRKLLLSAVDIGRLIGHDCSEVRRLAKSDPTFPRPRQISRGRGGAAKWYAPEVHAYLSKLPIHPRYAENGRRTKPKSTATPPAAGEVA